MPAPISGSQLKTETPEDLHALADILIYYRQVLERAHTDVAELCAETPHAEPKAPRVKSDRPPKIIDRRLDPRASYRAVHLEIRREGILLEVRVRTALQHQWAELFERTADRLGRDLRYGEPRSTRPGSRELGTSAGRDRRDDRCRRSGHHLNRPSGTTSRQHGAEARRGRA
jgi:hypothetical protein